MNVVALGVEKIGSHVKEALKPETIQRAAEKRKSQLEFLTKHVEPSTPESGALRQRVANRMERQINNFSLENYHGDEKGRHAGFITPEEARKVVAAHREPVVRHAGVATAAERGRAFNNINEKLQKLPEGDPLRAMATHHGSPLFHAQPKPRDWRLAAGLGLGAVGLGLAGYGAYRAMGSGESRR